ncbi:soma ferritin-like [Branchiostoma floridae]|uniref:Ferritin n=1 Tax=Branchiostoma floridae TaxID=7739 RepID=A0A9J7N881_BRAFL|nr:soma ferritin-like [Branchiostoma floridae]
MSQESQIRQNYHPETEAAVNKQANKEHAASYTYTSLNIYFDRDDVALPGLQKFFKGLCDQKREFAKKWHQHQTERGGRVVLMDVPKPPQDSWGSPQDALETALSLEKELNQSMLAVYELAHKHDDEHTSDFIEDTFLHTQVDNIKTIGDHLTNLKRCGSGLGVYMFDRGLGKE